MIKRYRSYWEERTKRPLLPVQKEVFSRKGLLDPLKNVIILSPTSSGKSLIVEYFILHTLSQGKKVVYLSPFKSILLEKRKEFCEWMGLLNIDVKFSIHEESSDDNEIFKGNYDVLLTVYEKFGYFLQKKGHFLGNIGLIVFDEFTIIEDQKRGPYIDILLSYIKKANKKILITSSFFYSPEKLATYLNAELVISNKRTTPLRIGYFDSGVFYWKTEEGLEGEEVIIKDFSHGEDDFLILLETLWMRHDTSIVFFPTRMQARHVLSYMEERLPPLYENNVDIPDLPHTLFSEKLSSYILKGLGYHSRDLTYPERKYIEELAYNGKIRLLFATTTLAFGVNLPFRNVVFPGNFPVSKGVLNNMIGRAARGNMFEYGRAIFFTKGDIKVKDEETVLPVKFKDPYEEYTFFLRMITFDIHDKELYLVYDGKKETEDIYTFLMANGLIKADEQGVFPTLLGKMLATSGIDISSFLQLIQILQHEKYDKWEELVYHFTGIGILFHFYLDPVSRGDYFSWWPALQEIINVSLPIGHYTNKDFNRFRKTLIIRDFVRGEELYSIEKKYKITAGILLEFVDKFVWVLEFANNILDYIDLPREKVNFVKELKTVVEEKEENFVLIIDEERPDMVIYSGKKIPLTYKQFEFIKLLGKKPGKVVTYDEIMDAIWKDDYEVSPKQISYHKNELSKKLGKELIKSVKGRGLYLDLLPSEVYLNVKR